MMNCSDCVAEHIQYTSLYNMVSILIFHIWVHDHQAPLPFHSAREDI